MQAHPRAARTRATDFWGEDLAALRDLLEGVSLHLSRILQVGVRDAIEVLRSQ